MRFVIVTGMSGAGKTQALKILEDLGYFCVDNLPLDLTGKFAELAANPAQEYSKVALGLDVRSLFRRRRTLDEFFEIIQGYPIEILFLDCSTEQLVRRYKASRRMHPLAKNGRFVDGIAKEREYLEILKRRSDYLIDTSNLLTARLSEEMARLFSEEAGEGTVFLSILSFGYKYGIPSDADLVFDVRFLPNPFYVDELKHKTGNDEEVRAYVNQGGEADRFFEKLTDILEYLIPKYRAEGKRQLMICIGCTGGKHRSVTIANRLGSFFADQGEWPVSVLHRDISK